MKRDILLLNILKFITLMICLSFLVSCCHKKVPKLSVTMRADHPSKQESAFFIVHEFRVPEFVPDIGGDHLGAITGSGGSIRNGDGWTDILTAGHVCQIPEEFMFTDGVLTLFNIAGEYFHGRVVAVQEITDLCLIRINYERETADLAKKDPVPGDKVFYAGYPAGIYQPGFLHFFEGYFTGKDGGRNGIWNIASSGGSSGGLVVNSKGEVIGVISAVLIENHHVSFGATTEQIRNFLKKTKRCTPNNFCSL